MQLLQLKFNFPINPSFDTISGWTHLWQILHLKFVLMNLSKTYDATFALESQFYNQPKFWHKFSSKPFAATFALEDQFSNQPKFWHNFSSHFIFIKSISLDCPRNVWHIEFHYIWPKKIDWWGSPNHTRPF